MISSSDTYAELIAESNSEKLSLAKQAIEQGNRKQAYRLSREVTRLEPDNVNAWLYRAALTSNHKQRLACLSKVLSLAPENMQAQYGMYKALNGYLSRDPFLRYLEETDTLYRIVTGAGRVIIISKDRAPVAPFPMPERTTLKMAYRWLNYAFIGLLPAGLGALICAPIGAMYAWRSRLEATTFVERKRAMVALIYAGALWAIGLLFSLLFLIHL
jgi:hypothetical protein